MLFSFILIIIINNSMPKEERGKKFKPTQWCIDTGFYPMFQPLIRIPDPVKKVSWSKYWDNEKWERECDQNYIVMAEEGAASTLDVCLTGSGRWIHQVSVSSDLLWIGFNFKCDEKYSRN